MTTVFAIVVKVKRYENYNDWDGVVPVYYKHWLVCRECKKEFESRNHPIYAFEAAADHAVKEHGYIRENIRYEILQGDPFITAKKEVG